jgi:hypothetical protein
LWFFIWNPAYLHCLGSANELSRQMRCCRVAKHSSNVRSFLSSVRLYCSLITIQCLLGHHHPDSIYQIHQRIYGLPLYDLHLPPICLGPRFKPSRLTLIGLPDATVDISIWSSVEVGLSITAASLVTLRPLLDSLYHGRSYPRGRPKISLNTIPPGPDSITRLVSSSHAATLHETSEGHHRLENGPPEPVGTITVTKSSGDSKEDLEAQAVDVEGKYSI